MLKTVLIFVAGIICGFSLSWLAPSSIVNYWRSREHNRNKTIPLENRATGMYKGEEYLKKYLVDEVTVLCMVMTSPENHYRIAHIKATWGRRCNVLLFFSSADNETTPTIALPVAPGENYDWRRTKQAFKYVHDKNYLHDVDWVLKTDDETYVVVENLRYLLVNFDPNEAVYFGRYVKYGSVLPGSKNEAHGFMDGRAGYVLSKEAARKFAVEGFDRNKTCGEDENVDDELEMGKCMELLKVKAGVSEDRLGRGRFHPKKPSDHIRLQLVSNTFSNLTNTHNLYDDNLNCCSDLAITFHRISHTYMYTMEYFLYHIYPYGITRSTVVGPNLVGPNPSKFYN